ncbi:MAG: DEAD/DEAH box helicase [Planctomycetia bacterium]|nr:MAG: DEAD/DEAH box helicase [Planctomycetia bacterium]
MNVASPTNPDVVSTDPANPFAPSEAKPIEGPPIGFDDLGLDESILKSLRELKFQTPTPIQRELIPHALAGKDCLGQAKTGTGKTAAFAIPLIQLVQTGGGLQALVLVPTRELAVQVHEHFERLSKHHPVQAVVVYGGKEIQKNISALKRNPEIIVGTPGRVMDLMRRRLVDISHIRLAVLDEVDRMLDIGFREDIRRILKSIKGPHQTIFVSATIDPDIRALATTYMREPIELNVSRDSQLTVTGVDQAYVSVERHDKVASLVNWLRAETPKLALVFTNMKVTAMKLGMRLKKAGVNCMEIHGDLTQRRRDAVMKHFRASNVHVLVATDLAARGLDVPEISHVINYDIPEDPAVYVHRVGRTARAGAAGTAITFVGREEGKLLTGIEMLINKEVRHITPEWVVRTDMPADSRGAAAAPAAAPAAPAKNRLSDALHRDPALDSMGLQPVRRTLGSRFRTRRGR